MKLGVKQIINREICHFADKNLLITSKYNKIYIKKKDVDEFTILLPQKGWKRLFAPFRLTRRALRLDKCNVVSVENGFVGIRQGKVFHYNENTRQLQITLHLTNCRNVLHQSIAVINKKHIYFGEYGNNASREAVPVYRSIDCGQNWEVIYSFPPKKIKHVHGCYHDPYEDKIWTVTGDFENECHILCADYDFNHIEWIGDGQQMYRTCRLIFQENSIHWIMDSPLQDSYHVVLDRKTRKAYKRQLFQGPVWYTKKLDDNYYLAATAQEIGPGVKDHLVHFMVSRDLEKWKDIYQFVHDGYPKRYFKFGVISFADGNQDSHSFYMFAEAIKGFDGNIVECEILE